MAAADQQPETHGHPDTDGELGPAVLERDREVTSCGGRALEAVLVGSAELTPDERGEAGAPPDLEVSDLGVGHGPEPCDPGPLGPNRLQVTEIRRPADHEVAGLTSPSDEQRIEHLEDRDQNHLRNDSKQVKRRVAGEHGPDAVDVLLPAAFVDGLTIAECFDVARDGRRCHDDPGTCQMRTPAEGEVVVVEVDGRVESADRGEEVRPDQGGRARDHEHVADRIVLLLVELVAVDQGGASAGLVDRLADAEQTAPVAPGDELGPDHPGVGPKCLLDQGPDCVGRQRDVVVTAQVEVGTLDDADRVVDRPAESWVVIEPSNERVRQVVGDTARWIDFARGIDHEHGEIRIVLARQRGHRLVEPLTRVAGHDDGDDRRCADGGSLHDATTVVPDGGPEGYPRYRRAVNDLSAEGLVKVAKDSLYVSVGLGLIAFQRVQVRRHELMNTTDTSGLNKLVGDNLKMLDERVGAAVDEVRDTVRKLF